MTGDRDKFLTLRKEMMIQPKALEKAQSELGIRMKRKKMFY